MTNRIHPAAFLGLATGMFLVALMMFTGIAHANPSNTTSGATGTTATTTALAYLTPGTATTTTPVYDSLQSDGTNQANQGNTYATDSAVFALQVNASSTASVFGITFEYSNGANCGVTPAGCDWYQDTLYSDASTTPVVSISTIRSYQFVFASSTVGGISANTGLLGINGTNNRATRVMSVKTPMRYVRAVITDTGAGGAIVEAAFIPKKESK